MALSLRTSVPAALLLLAACKPSDAARPAPNAASAALTFDSARVVSGATQVGSAPTFAVGAGGRRAVAWVSAPNGGTDGRLFVASVSADGSVGAPVELRDALGPIEPRGESPPKITFGPGGALYAMWVVGKEVPDRRFPMSALRFARSDDGGRTWSTPASVTDVPQPFGSFGFHSLQAARGDTLYAAWLDGRTGKTATFASRSVDGGRTWAANVEVDTTGPSCPCCRTAVVAGHGDTVYAAWRKIYDGNRRAVVVARSIDGGHAWSAPVAVQRDGWVIDGCPEAGPSVQTDADGHVHVAWWSGKEGAAGVFYATSTDGGTTFGTPIPLGVAPFSRPAHVQLALADRDVVVAWDDGTVQQPRVVVRVSHDRGATFAPTVVASAPGRPATFPVLATDARRVTLAWSESPSGAPAEAVHHHGDKNMHMPLPSVGQKRIVMRSGTLGAN